MKYSETELTETIKIISYLRSIRLYAVIIMVSSLLYSALQIHNAVNGAQLYLLYGLAGVMISGGLALIVRPNYRTAVIYGLSCIIAGVVFSFCVFYYSYDPPGFFTTIGIIAGLMVAGHGLSVGFGNRAKGAFSKASQRRVSFVNDLMKSLKHPRPNDKEDIRCTYMDDNKQRRNLTVKFLDGVACFMLDGHPTPVFLDRNNVYISKLQDEADFVLASIFAYNHDWLEAQFTPEDYKKYEAWKDL